jgi:hypothetical protein
MRWIQTECPVKPEAAAELAERCGLPEMMPATEWRRVTVDLAAVESYFDDRSGENVEASGAVLYMRSGESWPIRMSYDDFDRAHRIYRTRPLP